MKKNRFVLFAGMGFLGGALGGVAADFTVPLTHDATFLADLEEVTLWASVASTFISAALFWASEVYARKPVMSARELGQAVTAGLIAGALAGCLAQLVYSLPLRSTSWKEYALKPACWGFAGALLGWRFSRRLPNFGLLRGIVGGCAGGFVGGSFFVYNSGAALPVMLRRSLGMGLLGGALGAAMLAADILFRKASLEIIWAPKEVTWVPLGPQPVYIGGGDDHIFISGLPQHAAGIVLKKERVEYIDGTSGKRTPLKDKSRVKIGQVEVVVHAKI